MDIRYFRILRNIFQVWLPEVYNVPLLQGQSPATMVWPLLLISSIYFLLISPSLSFPNEEEETAPSPPWATARCGGMERWRGRTPAHIPSNIVKPDTTDRLVWFEDQTQCKYGYKSGNQLLCACEGGRPTTPFHTSLLGHREPERCELGQYCDDSDWEMLDFLVPKYGSNGTIYMIPKWIPKIPKRIQQKHPTIKYSSG